VGDIVLLTIKRPLEVGSRKVASPWNPEEKVGVPSCSSCYKKFPEKTEFFMFNKSYFCFECVDRFATNKAQKEGEIKNETPVP